MFFESYGKYLLIADDKKMVSNSLIKFLLIFCILILFLIGIYNDILQSYLSWKYASTLVNYTGKSLGTYSKGPNNRAARLLIFYNFSYHHPKF